MELKSTVMSQASFGMPLDQMSIVAAQNEHAADVAACGADAAHTVASLKAHSCGRSSPHDDPTAAV